MTTARAILDAAMTEAELLDAVVDAALTFGWLVSHIPDRLYALAAKDQRFDALIGAEGLPDLILAREGDETRGGRVIVAELKTNTGKVKLRQQAWLQAFISAGIEAHVWRPVDLSSGRIDAVLRG